MGCRRGLKVRGSSSGVATSDGASFPSSYLRTSYSTTPLINNRMSFKTNATIASFGGKLLKLSHNATSTNCEMACNLYLPPQASKSKKIPLLVYLAGLTCTGDNGAEKGFFQHKASQRGIAILYPDTSPSPYQPHFSALGLAFSSNATKRR